MPRGIKEKQIPDIQVNQDLIYVGDIEGFIRRGEIARFKPLGISCDVAIAPYALFKLIKWAVKQNYVILNGEIYYKGRTHTERIIRDG